MQCFWYLIFENIQVTDINNKIQTINKSSIILFWRQKSYWSGKNPPNSRTL